MDWHALQHVLGLCGDHSFHFNLLDSLAFMSGYYTNTLHAWWLTIEKIKEIHYAKGR